MILKSGGINPAGIILRVDATKVCYNEEAMKKMSAADQLAQFRQEYKGVYLATKNPQSAKVLAMATDYQSLEKQLTEKKLADKPIAIQYLEPKRAICAYGISVSG